MTKTVTPNSSRIQKSPCKRVQTLRKRYLESSFMLEGGVGLKKSLVSKSR